MKKLTIDTQSFRYMKIEILRFAFGVKSVERSECQIHQCTEVDHRDRRQHNR